MPEITLGPTPTSVRVYEFDALLPTEITAQLALDGLNEMVDAAVFDFDGDLDHDIYFDRGESPLGLLQETDLVIESAVAVFSNERGFSFGTDGDVTFSMFPVFQVPLSTIFVGASGAHPVSQTFTLSSADTNNHGIAPHAPGVDRGHYVGYDPVAERWTVSLSWDAFAQRNFVITSDLPLTDVQTIAWVPGQSTPGDLFLRNDNGLYVNETVSRGLATPSSGRSNGAGDLDTNGDVDLYVVATGAVENRPNPLYVNDRSGHFALQTDAGGAAGSSAGRGDAAVVADCDNDGFLDVFFTNGKEQETAFPRRTLLPVP